MAQRDNLIDWMNTYLEVDQFNDYCPNGLQVEGRETVHHVVCAVSASLDAISYAIEKNADMLLVHHGLIWKGDWNTLVGPYRQKIKSSLDHGLNIVAYHLPLDAHLEVGNAAALATLLSFTHVEAAFEYQGKNLGVICSNSNQDDDVLDTIKNSINTKSIIIKNRPIQKVGIVTGAGQGEFQNAIDQGCDTYITGESTEWVYHKALEYGVNYISCGHHASEQFGVKALSQKLNETFSAKIEYLDLKNPF